MKDEETAGHEKAQSGGERVAELTGSEVAKRLVISLPLALICFFVFSACSRLPDAAAGHAGRGLTSW